MARLQLTSSLTDVLTHQPNGQLQNEPQVRRERKATRPRQRQKQSTAITSNLKSNLNKAPKIIIHNNNEYTKTHGANILLVIQFSPVHI